MRRVYSAAHASSQQACVVPSDVRIAEPSLAPIESTVAPARTRVAWAVAMGAHGFSPLSERPGRTSLSTVASSPRSSARKLSRPCIVESPVASTVGGATLAGRSRVPTAIDARTR